MTDRAHSGALDAADHLAGWRDEFVIHDPELVYLDGNSLGMTPRRTVDAVRHVMETQWAGDLISSWWKHGWLDMPLTVGDELAPLIGALPGEVVVNESTTVCLFQLVNVALDLTERAPGERAVIAVDDHEFPTDRYVVDGIARLRPGVVVRSGVDDLDGVVVDERPPLVAGHERVEHGSDRLGVGGVERRHTEAGRERGAAPDVESGPETKAE